MTTTQESTGGRRVLITGAASGLGAALARSFAKRGDRVLLTDLTPAADVPEGDARYMLLDVTAEDAWEAARQYVEETWGGLDILVNNAGVAGGGRLDICTLDEWQWLIDVNLLGMVRGIKTFTPMLKEGDGDRHIVNIASLAALVHPAGMASYNCAKAAVLALTETVHHELGHTGIKAKAVCPSYFRTSLASSLRTTDTAVSSIVQGLIAGSETSADDVAEVVVDSLSSDELVLLPDEAARQTFDLKENDRAKYDEVMAGQAAKMRARASDS